jgi:hypothetical protein
MSLGSAIEDRMNAVSVDKLAGVKLTGHWYNPNSSNYVVARLAQHYVAAYTRDGHG